MMAGSTDDYLCGASDLKQQLLFVPTKQVALLVFRCVLRDRPSFGIARKVKYGQIKACKSILFCVFNKILFCSFVGHLMLNVAPFFGFLIFLTGFHSML